ncbi:MAG: hypothetical protein COC06_03335 [Bacteroidales bacterium]|nr:hypothetical protein [Labilibaculum sp.]PCH70854.1 MAG: hypothetical protein COC06_03335 [Bacteroidales bacterium]
MTKKKSKIIKVSSDSQTSLKKKSFEEAIFTLNLELLKYPKNVVIENIKFEFEEKNGEFEAVCVCTIKE